VTTGIVDVEARDPRARAGVLLEHDPEKWEPVFGKDHAQTKSWTMIRFNLIGSWSRGLKRYPSVARPW
jgi:hypothetical protein